MICFLWEFHYSSWQVQLPAASVVSLEVGITVVIGITGLFQSSPCNLVPLILKFCHILRNTDKSLFSKGRTYTHIHTHTGAHFSFGGIFFFSLEINYVSSNYILFNVFRHLEIKVKKPKHKPHLEKESTVWLPV